MFKLDAAKATSLHQKLQGGIQATMIGVPGQQSSVILKVYSYAYDRLDGKGELIYGCSNTRGGDDFVEESWSIAKWQYFTYVKPGFKPISPPGNRKSTDYANAVQFYSRVFDDVCKKLGGDCPKFRQFYPLLPVTIELTITNAVVKKIKIPGIGEINADTLAAQKLKGARLKIDNAKINLEFSDQKIISVAEDKTEYYKMAWLRKSQSGTIMQAIVPATGYIHLAATSKEVIEKALINNNYTNNNGRNKGLKDEIAPIFITQKGETRTNYFSYSIYRRPGEKLLLRVTNQGPFVMGINPVIQGVSENNVNRSLLHKPAYGTLVCAHRGYWEGVNVPENNPLAFKPAIDMQADMIELDVKLTKDKVLVLFHDDPLFRLTNYDSKAWHDPKNQIGNLNYSDCNNIGGACNPLKSALLKDRFGNVVPNSRMLTLEEAFRWFKDLIDNGVKVIVALDKITKQSDMAYDIALKTGMEDYLLFKGPDKPGAYTPAELDKRFGSLMQQIIYTPYVFEERPELRAAFNEWDRREKENFWVVPGYEMQMKTDSVHAPPFRKAGNIIMKELIDSRRLTKWIGITHLFPTSIDGVDLKKLYDGCSIADLQNPEKAASCSNFDWRTDMDFDVNYVRADYFITDRPDVTIKYLRNMNTNKK